MHCSLALSLSLPLHSIPFLSPSLLLSFSLWLMNKESVKERWYQKGKKTWNFVFIYDQPSFPCLPTLARRGARSLALLHSLSHTGSRERVSAPFDCCCSSWSREWESDCGWCEACGENTLLSCHLLHVHHLHPVTAIPVLLRKINSLLLLLPLLLMLPHKSLSSLCRTMKPDGGWCKQCFRRKLMGGS